MCRTLACFAFLFVCSACGGSATGRPATDQQAGARSTATDASLSGTDFHLHLSPDHGVDEALAALDEAQLERACALSGGWHQAPGCEGKDWSDCHQEQRAFTVERNDWVLTESRKSDRLIGFCGIPIGPAFSPEEVARCASKGARGLKLHSFGQQVSVAAEPGKEELRRIAKAAEREGLVLLIHVDFDRATEVEALFSIARDHPKLNVVAAHLLGPNVAMMMEAPSNVFIDVSGLVHAPSAKESFAHLFTAIGPQRILFGSDWPQLSPKAHVDYLNEMPLSDEARMQILASNAIRLFGP